jgi:hypothetical protein
MVFLSQACMSNYEKNLLDSMPPEQRKCTESKINRQTQFPRCRITECGKYAFCPGVGMYINGQLQGQQNDNEDESGL